MFRCLMFSIVLFSVSATQLLAADDAPANSELAVDVDFSKPMDGSWHVNTGKWKISDGTLKCSEVASEKHAAAARYKVVSSNAVYQTRFRFVRDGKAFHLGFDPAKGQLKKRGHLFSVIITPDDWKLMKHVDKDRPEEKPNEVIATAKRKFESGKWYKLRIMTWGTFVRATIDDDVELKGSHPTFGVSKPTVVLRCTGDGVEIDELKVWRQI